MMIFGLSKCMYPIPKFDPYFVEMNSSGTQQPCGVPECRSISNNSAFNIIYTQLYIPLFLLLSPEFQQDLDCVRVTDAFTYV